MVTVLTMEYILIKYLQRHHNKGGELNEKGYV